MKNRDLIENFIVRGATAGTASNLKIQGDDLINYKTVIARRLNDAIVLNNYYYSVSTKTNQNHITRIAKNNNVRLIIVETEGALKGVANG